MKRSLINIILFFAIGVAIGLLASRQCAGPNKLVLTDVDTVFVDRVIERKIPSEKIVTKYVAKPYHVLDTFWMKQPIDTIEVLAKYHTRKNFISTYNDTSLELQINHSAYKAISSIDSINYKIKYTEKVVTKTHVLPPKTRFYFGAISGFSGQGNNNIVAGPQIAIVTKKGLNLNVNYNLLSPQFNLMVGATWQVGGKK